MAYTPDEIYRYIKDSDKETVFLQSIMRMKQNFSIAEITDKRFRITEDKEIKFSSPIYKIKADITDDDIKTAVLNGIYVSAFISRYNDDYNVHFLVHRYPETMKSKFEEAILSEVIQYMIMMTIIRLRLDTPKKVDEYLT